MGQAYVTMSCVRSLEDLFMACVPDDLTDLFLRREVQEKLLQYDGFVAEE